MSDINELFNDIVDTPVLITRINAKIKRPSQGRKCGFTSRTNIMDCRQN